MYEWQWSEIRILPNMELHLSPLCKSELNRKSSHVLGEGACSQIKLNIKS